MVRVGLGLYKYSIGYGWKHSVTNGVCSCGSLLHKLVVLLATVHLQRSSAKREGAWEFTIGFGYQWYLRNAITYVTQTHVICF